MNITTEEIRLIALAFAATNRHPDPHAHADDVVAAFNELVSHIPGGFSQAPAAPASLYAAPQQEHAEPAAQQPYIPTLNN
ncbi:hypothetical protein [Chromobacterium subtsugae]|uniref:hypothetical protein n=1 Tax=Chromobacterium subtsugae TaxID=251747 RepID=UPI000641000E|nr:hypothetical protein [Chromobacterium subtsugae]